MPQAPPTLAEVLAIENQRLVRRLAREREIRHQAEAIAERGLRDLYRKQTQLEFLEQIATLANQGGSALGVLEAALACICRFTGLNAGHACLPAGKTVEAGGHLWPTNIWHVDPGLDLDAFRAATSVQMFRRGEGLTGRVWATAAPEWIPDLRQPADFLRAAPALACGLHTAIAIPLLIEAEIVGALEFFATAALVQDDGLVQALTQAATQLSRVIERERAQDRLHDSLHDHLTGLPNRANLVWRLDQALQDCRLQQGATVGVLFLDLDRFKLVNDSLGHHAGDMLIREVGRRLASAIRSFAESEDPDEGRSIILARLGGDEFAILLGGSPDLGRAQAVAARLHAALLQPIGTGSGDVLSSASIGISISDEATLSGDTIMRNADMAMYHAKAAGHGQTAVFTPAMHRSAVQRLTLEGELRDALEREEFLLHYQPIVRLQTGEVVGFEALVRWRTRSGALRRPDSFIPVAEETGMIVNLGLWVLREACRTARGWAEACPADPPRCMSVNLSARQFAQPDLVDQVRQVIAQTSIDPATLRLEITETATVDDAERTVTVLSELCALGIRISIDDFGTGFSSLSYLHRFPLHLLKIDRSFVSRMETSRESLQIVRTLLSLARSLNMEVVAEGAETAAEVQRLRLLGCDYCQGFYFAPPLPAPAALDYIRTRHMASVRAGQVGTALPDWIAHPQRGVLNHLHDRTAMLPTAGA